MGAFLIRRILLSIPTLFFLTLISFAFIHAAPGDAVDVMVDPLIAREQGPEALAARRRALGLDQPVPVQYVLWLKEAVSGNLGYSFIYHRPVTAMVGERLLGTLELTIPALVLAIILGVSAGIYSSLHRYSLLDHTLSILSYGAWALPNFFLGLVLIYIFSVQLKVLPSAGMFAPDKELDLIDRLRHFIMPVSVLGVQFLGLFMRQTRSAMLEVIGSDFVTTARAKGLREAVITAKHILPNALITIITIVGLSLPLLVTGAIITEVVFTWSGMGNLTLNAILSRDYPVIMGVILVVGLGVVVFNLLTDLLYAFVDPRIKYASLSSGKT